jgi:hypothetical protein
MNIYEFIGSPIIRELFEKKQHEFDTYEMAVIVANSDKPFEEKIKAYEELVDYYPDETFAFTANVLRPRNTFGISISYSEISIHKFLLKRLAEMRKAKGSNEDLVYKYLCNERISAPSFIEEKDICPPFWFNPYLQDK